MRKLVLFLLAAIAGAAAYVLWRRRAEEQSAPLYELAPLPGAPPAAPAADAAIAAHAHDEIGAAAAPIGTTPSADAPPADSSADAAIATHDYEPAPEPVEPIGAAPAEAESAPEADDEAAATHDYEPAPADIAADAALAAQTLAPPAPADVIADAAEEASGESLASGETVDAPIADVANLSAEDTTGTGYTSLMPEEVAAETDEASPGTATPSADGSELPDLPEDDEPAPAFAPPTGPIDLNAATLDELIALPGIGPYLAQRIVDFRSARGGFKAVSDLLDISGIGPNNIREFEEYLTVSATTDDESNS